MEKIIFICGNVLTIASVLGLLIKVLNRVKHLADSNQTIAEGHLCLLRNAITATYYKHNNEDTPTLREYERKNLDKLYDAYTAAGGNSFVSDIYSTMREWKVVN